MGRTRPPGRSTPTSDQITKPAKYSLHQPAAKLFKLPPRGVFPERDLHDVEVYTKDYKRLTNLLNVSQEGPFHVFGVIYSQDDQYEDLRLAEGSGNYQLEIKNVASYSIDSNPFAEIWVNSDYGYFKIAAPSIEYAPIFATMQDGVEIMHALTELQDELEEVEEAVRTQDAMYKLAVKDGSGFTEDEILDHVNLEQHAGFLKSHMSQNSDTLGGKILTWLTEEYLVRDKTRALTRSPSPERIPTPPREPTPILPPEPILQTAIRPGDRYARSSPVVTGSGLVDAVDWMLDFVLAEDPRNTKFNVTNIWNALYRQCNVWRPPLGRAIVKLHSSALLDRLPDEWKGTPFCTELEKHATYSCTAEEAARYISEAKERPPRGKRGTLTTAQIHAITEEQWFEEAAEMTEIQIRGTGKGRGRKSKNTDYRGDFEGDTDFDISMSDAAPPPTTTHQPHHAQLVIQTVEEHTGEPARDEQGRSEDNRRFFESITSRSADDQAKLDKANLRTPNGKKRGRPAGKKSALKPKTAKRRFIDPDEPEDDRADRRRKRSRNDLENPGSTSDTEGESSSTDEEEEKEDPVELILKAVNDNPISKNMVRGPNGSIKCVKCEFWLEHNPETPEGRQNAVEHHRFHYQQGDRDVVSLVETEGTRTNHSVDNLTRYLMEKIPEVHLDDFGVPYPQAIKRKALF